ncbi:MAG: PD-(D/E)XK nuclease family protein [Planctomycetes bacterium]|nr:PD-(D/E)XK nuclease family protein [Planctomycetota bacterium]
MGEIRREFLGFERPLLDHVVERWCASLAPDADTSRTLFVLPGGRAARELEARLAARLAFARPPPRVVTEGLLAGALSRDTVRAASPLARTLAWRAAFAELAPELRAKLWRGAETDGSEKSLARAASRAFAELCAHALEPDDVAAHLARSGRRDEARWRAFAHAVRAYRARLESVRLVDPADAARHVLARGLLRDDLAVELVGCVDLPRSARALLDALPRAARAWVYATDAERDDFDAHGGLVVERWADRDLPLATEQWRVVQGPDDQARAVQDELARLAPTCGPHDVTVGVLDPEVRPFLERRLFAAGLEPRWAAGGPLASSALARLLALVERFLADGRFDDFRELLVHPDVEAALERDLGTSLVALGSKLDDYAADCVPARVGVRFAPNAEHADELAAARDALVALLGELAGERAAPLARWADELARFVGDVFEEVDLAATVEPGWSRAQSFVAFGALLDELRDPRLGERVLRARDALELVLERIGSIALPPPPRAGAAPALELFGWLELPLDPAPHAVIAGFDEGFVPSPAAESAWLPERLRADLGLGHAARRLARDVWAASVLCRSRTTIWISSKKSLSGDPRVPSRLVFRTTRDEAVERAARAFVHSARTVVPPAGAVEPFRPTLLEGARGERTGRIERIGVTAFKQYLASPYLFYLRYVLRLETIEERVLELDPMRFGTLAHAVLQDFGESGLAGSTNASAIADFLSGRLSATVQRTLDPKVHAAVLVQVEQLRARLARFAEWQARTTLEGWRIRRVEFQPSRRVEIACEAGALQLVGRVDRIDQHATTGRWRVIDYKTSDSGKTPRETHLRRKTEWIDLQLPLYRHLVRELCGDAPIELGYVALDAGVGEELFLPAEWSAEQLAAADATAESVVADVLAGRFEQVGEDEPANPILAALCGFGLAARSDAQDVEPKA